MSSLRIDAPSGQSRVDVGLPLAQTEMWGRTPTIYDVARVAGVAPSTVSRALSRPDRVRYQTAEHVRRAAAELGYRKGHLDRMLSERGTRVLVFVVADIANPVYFGMIRGAERAASDRGLTVLVLDSQESEPAERSTLERLIPLVDGLVLSSSWLSDAAVRSLAKRKPVILLNRTVSEVSSLVIDSVHAIKKAAEHLTGLGHSSICYLAGPEASWADGMRWRGLRTAGLELDLHARRLGPFQPTMPGGAAAAQQWLRRPTTAVIAYNDLMAIGFVQKVTAAGLDVPGDVSVIGFDNIVDGILLEPHLTTIAAPLVSLGSAAVARLVKNSQRERAGAEKPVLLPARLVVRGSTGPCQASRAV